MRLPAWPSARLEEPEAQDADPGHRREWGRPERHYYGVGPWLWSGVVRTANGQRKTQLRSTLIETDYPTFHTMALADLDGDGKPELITGKQLLAHNGGTLARSNPCFLLQDRQRAV
jgi:hypothetical protein